MKQEWVNIARKSYPENNKFVLLWDGLEVGIGFHNYGRFYTYGEDGIIEVDITHWMPLPEPPKEGG